MATKLPRMSSNILRQCSAETQEHDAPASESPVTVMVKNAAPSPMQGSIAENGEVWIAQAGPDSPGFGKRQREKSEPELSLNPHGCSFPVSP